MDKIPKPGIAGGIFGAIICCGLALYVLITGDPTQILLGSRSRGLQQPDEAALSLLMAGSVFLIVVLTRRFPGFCARFFFGAIIGTGISWIGLRASGLNSEPLNWVYIAGVALVFGLLADRLWE